MEKGDLNAALEKIGQALQALDEAEASDLGLDLMYVKGLVALTTKAVATGAIAQAELKADGRNDLREIEQAKERAAEGDALLMAFDHVGVVGKYKEAVRQVQGVLTKHGVPIASARVSSLVCDCSFGQE